MTGQKVAKIPILPTLVSKKNPVAGTPPSGSMILETKHVAKESDQNEIEF